MKRLSPAKRNQLIMVVIASAALIGVVYFLLISPQKIANTQLAGEIKAAKTRLDQDRAIIKQAESTASAMAESVSRLGRAEEDIATGDVYQWMYDLIRRFKATHQVDIPNISQPLVGDVDVLADFPYKQAKVNLNGTAYFHDLGKFVADFENAFPHIRLVNLTVEPAGGPPGSDQERLSFRMDVIALVRPNN